MLDSLLLQITRETTQQLVPDLAGMWPRMISCFEKSYFSRQASSRRSRSRGRIAPSDSRTMRSSSASLETIRLVKPSAMPVACAMSRCCIGRLGCSNSQRAMRALLGAKTLRGLPRVLNRFSSPSIRTRIPGAKIRALPLRSSQATSASSQRWRPTGPMNGTATSGIARRLTAEAQRRMCSTAAETEAAAPEPFHSTTKVAPARSMTASASGTRGCWRVRASEALAPSSSARRLATWRRAWCCWGTCMVD